MTDALMLLRDADPAARLDVAPPEEELERIVAEPPATRRRGRFARRRRLVLAAGLAALAAASAGLLPSVLSRESVGGLAARAYAATALGDQIRHSRTETEFVSGSHRSTSFTEAWQYREEAHWIVGSSLNPGSTSEHYLGKDDVVRTTIHQPGEPDQHQTMTPDFSPEARDIIEGIHGSFVERFRRFYREDRLHDEGRTTFAGRPAQRYVAERPPREVRGAERPLTERSVAEFFIDPDTALPLGRTTHSRYYDSDGRLTQESRLTERVIVLEELPPTSENLAKVRAP